jgi:uncharacterized membrane protein YkvI
MAFLAAALIGGLIPTFLLSRLALWLLKRWQGGYPRAVIANISSWIACTVVGGVLMAHNETSALELAQVYALPQLVCQHAVRTAGKAIPSA